MDLKHTLSKMDGETGQLEVLNDKHRSAQSHLSKGAEHEAAVGADLSLECKDLLITLNKLRHDENLIALELDQAMQQQD